MAGRCPLHGLQEGGSVGGYPPQGLREGLIRGDYGGIRPITPTTCPTLARVGIGLIGAIGLISPIKVSELNGG